MQSRNTRIITTYKLFRLLILGMLVGADVGSAFSQTMVDTSYTCQNTVFVSGLGNGLLYSISWDNSWPIGNNRHWSVSVGGSYVPSGYESTNFPIISIPVQMNWYRGRNHNREHGVGLSYGSGWYGGYSIDGQPIASQGLYLFTKPIGYGYQGRNGGFFFRLNLLAWARIVEFNRSYVEAYDYWESPPILPWLGIDLGYTLRNKPTL